MACDTMRRPEQTLADRMNEVKAALAKLEARLSAGAVRVSIGPTGAVVFQCWADADRAGLSDACTYRSLTAASSVALRQAIARAEAMSGRRVNAQAVAAGHHSHDGGHTWHKGH